MWSNNYCIVRLHHIVLLSVLQYDKFTVCTRIKLVNSRTPVVSLLHLTVVTVPNLRTIPGSLQVT